jgi:sulfite oxidase
VAATIVCAGNRRAELAAARPIPGETAWGAGAIGNAVWTGVRLRDVLERAGVGGNAAHVAFQAYDRTPEAPHFGASIPLAKALAPEVLLAHSMNGGRLPGEHGAPLRVVVPGYIGARSVKWIARATVQEQPSTNYFQARAYRLLPSESDESGFPLGELAVNSMLCRSHVSGSTAHVEGCAFTGGGRTIERVEVSVDRGATWTTATFTTPADRWSWRFWKADVQLAPGRNEAAVRAWDSAANTQPEDPAKLWNPKGYVCNAWHRTVLTG